MDSLLTIAVVFLGVFTQSLAGFGSALVAMALLIYYVGALDWTGIDAGRMNLVQPKQV